MEQLYLEFLEDDNQINFSSIEEFEDQLLKFIKNNFFGETISETLKNKINDSIFLFIQKAVSLNFIDKQYLYTPVYDYDFPSNYQKYWWDLNFDLDHGLFSITVKQNNIDIPFMDFIKSIWREKTECLYNFTFTYNNEED